MGISKYKHSEVEDLKSEIKDAGVPMLCADVLILRYESGEDWIHTRVTLSVGHALSDIDQFIEKIEEAFGWSCHFDIERSFIWFTDGSWLEQYSEIAPYTDGESETNWHRRSRPAVPESLN